MIGLAWAVLFLWPVVALVLYCTTNVQTAAIVTLLGGYLLLPSGLQVDVPLLPGLDKFSISVIAAFVLSLSFAKNSPANMPMTTGWVPKSAVVLTLIICLMLGVFGTVFTNGDMLFYGFTVLPGLGFRDIVSVIVELSFTVVSFILGRKLLASPDAQRTFLKVLVIWALAYSLLALWEVRMSPQLHLQIYGFFPHSFAQQIRAGGFRPVVFLNHGLSVATFFVFATVGAVILARATQGRQRMWWMLSVAWFLMVLFLCKTLGALMIAALLVPVAFFLRTRTQLIVALCISGAVLTYPVLRSADLVPVDRILEFAESVDPERAQSFSVRMLNEEALLSKALERPVFGWGGWSRPRVFDETGRDTSVTDGSWVIVLGAGGWVRYLTLYGLLCWGIISAVFVQRQQVDIVFSGIALILCVKVINIIPNSGFEPFIWLCAGGLVGQLEKKSWGFENSPHPVPNLGPSFQYARDFARAQDAVVDNNHTERGNAPVRTNTYRRPDMAGSNRK